MSALNTISSAEPVVSKSYTESGFTSIFNMTDGNITFTQGPVFSLTAIGQQLILDQLSIQVKDAQLVISYLTMIPAHVTVAIVITAPFLNQIKISGTGDFSSGYGMNSAELNLLLSSSGNLTLASLTVQSLVMTLTGSGSSVINGGFALSEDINISSSGSVNSLNLITGQAAIDISGSGDAKVNVDQSLNVSISGSGNVLFKGSPILSSKLTGSGKAISLG